MSEIKLIKSLVTLDTNKLYLNTSTLKAENNDLNEVKYKNEKEINQHLVNISESKQPIKDKDYQQLKLTEIYQTTIKSNDIMVVFITRYYQQYLLIIHQHQPQIYQYQKIIQIKQ